MSKKTMSGYSSYNNAKTRCYNPNREYWHLYGGRGIKMSDDWKEDFLNFYRDMGPKPSSKHSLDRINPNGNYCKENCRWATPKEQGRNKVIPVQEKCFNCGKNDKGRMRKNLCHKCNEYYRRNKIQRPKNNKEIEEKRISKIIKAKSKPIYQYDKNGNFIKKWNSGIEASRNLNCSNSAISNCINGISKTSLGYIWLDKEIKSCHGIIHDKLSGDKAIELGLKNFKNEK